MQKYSSLFSREKYLIQFNPCTWLKLFSIFYMNKNFFFKKIKILVLEILKKSSSYNLLKKYYQISIWWWKILKSKVPISFFFWKICSSNLIRAPRFSNKVWFLVQCRNFDLDFAYLKFRLATALSKKNYLLKFNECSL